MSLMRPDTCGLKFSNYKRENNFVACKLVVNFLRSVASLGTFVPGRLDPRRDGGSILIAFFHWASVWGLMSVSLRRRPKTKVQNHSA